MGIETEYGISVPGHPTANAMAASSQIVNAYVPGALARERRARWDFEEENPLRDARGFDMTREVADPSQLTDEDLGLANVILTNGARLYVDHAHPEYSTPEVTNPLDGVRWDKAGELVMAEAARRAATVPGSWPIQLYKNNTDNKGASYGCHENYLTARATPFSEIVRHLTPFFVTRQVFCGAGRVGVGADGKITSWEHKIAGSSIYARLLGAAFKGVDDDVVEGAITPIYSAAARHVTFQQQESLVPTSWWRGVGPLRSAFVMESAVDEVAHMLGQNAVIFDHHVFYLDAVQQRCLGDRRSARFGLLGERREREGGCERNAVK